MGEWGVGQLQPPKPPQLLHPSLLVLCQLQAPRELMLTVNRTGGSLGTVTVDYSITYLPPTNPSETAAGAMLTFAGFVQFQGGMSARDFSVTLPDNAFLEVGGSFMATIENATLVSGGKDQASLPA